MTRPRRGPRPPRVARVLIRRLLWSADRDFVSDDLDEEFEELLVAHGPRTARGWYRRQVLRSIVPVIAWRLGRRGSRQPGAMTQLPTSASAKADRMGALLRFRQDVRQAARSVVRDPRYAATVIATFALASGANIAVFSVVNSVLLKPLPYEEPERLAMAFRVTDHGSESRVSYLDFLDWREAATSFDTWAAYSESARTWLAESGAERWRGIETTPELFEVLGVPPLHGRTLQPGSDDIGDPVIVLSHALWQRRFGSDPSLIGRTIRFDGGTRTVVGVMPPGFYFPTPDEEYWIPLAASGRFLEQRGAWSLLSIGRLADDIPMERAQGELLAIAQRVDEENAEDWDGSTAVRVERRHEVYVGDTRRLFGILLGAVALVLTIACANIANIALTRASVRRRELAVRAALGAGRGRLARQLVTEHLLLALAGAAVGLFLSFAIVRGFTALAPADLPRIDEVGVDLIAFAYATLIALLSGLIFGSAPAIMASRTGLSRAINDAGRGSMSRVGRRTLHGLVTAQVAMAVILVLGASLLVNSFLRLSSVRPGFDTDGVLIMGVQLASDRYQDSESIEAFYSEVRRRLVDRPGIEGVGFSSHLPFSGSGISASYVVETTAGGRVDADDLQLEIVGSGYFDAVGIPMLVGRDVHGDDGAGSSPVAVINQTMADLHWPGGNAVGARFTLDDSGDDVSWHTVVGVVGSTLKTGLDDVRHPVAYFPRQQFQSTYGIISGRSGYLVVRAPTAPAAVIPTVRSEIARIDRNLPLTDIRTSADMVAGSVAAPRFRTLVVSAFALLALLVALVGVYGVMAFAVARRTREIGIRMSLGASDRRVLVHVLRSGLGVVGLGIAIGVVSGLAASRLLSAMLFGLTPTDLSSYAAAAGFVTVAGLAACYLPARRASRVEPVVALREE